MGMAWRADVADRNDARRVGWIAGYGLAMARRDNPSVVVGQYTPWTSFVPGWVPDKQSDPIAVAWLNGWREGMDAGKAEWPDFVHLEEVRRVRAAEHAANRRKWGLPE